MRFHAQTAGVTLTAQQPELNLARTAMQALAAVLGGAQSLHTNALDEALALPTERAAMLALRTQQIIAHESGVAGTVDPLGGSYFVETLTDEMEREARRYLDRIDDMGGMLAAIDAGYPQREIADAAYRDQSLVDSGGRIIVGVNAYAADEPFEIPVLRIHPAGEQRQRERLRDLRRTRDGTAHRDALRALDAAARTGTNVMPPLINAAMAGATLGEMCDVLRQVFGVYEERAVV
jgi:methylmalonyl-CoA mutase N-terminal domain/subunit